MPLDVKKKPNQSALMRDIGNLYFEVPLGMHRFSPTFGGGAGGSDTVAPTLSSPTDAASGTTTAELTVTTDEDNGTLYTVVTTSATPPTAAQVKAGTDHADAAAAFADDQAVVATGSHQFSATGLTAETAYFTYFMHEDVATNQSSVSAADGFTTDSEGAAAITAATSFL